MLSATTLPTSVALIHPRRAKPFHRQGWIYEEKYDGWRIVAFKDDGRVRLISRRGRDHTDRFPDVAAAIARLSPRTLILDGEVCVFDAKLVSQFHLLMDPGAELATPPVFMAFDCLRLRVRDLRPLPLRDRRKALEDVISGAKLVFPARRLEADGLAAWATVQERGYEELVAKDEQAPYNPAHSSAAWFKVKVRHEARFVVVGFGGHVARTPCSWPSASATSSSTADVSSSASAAALSRRSLRARCDASGRRASMLSAGATSCGSSRASRSR